MPKLEATAVPLFSNVSPTAETGLPVVFSISVPVPLTLNVLPPGLAAVPRSTLPPVIWMAAWAEPVDSSIVLLRTTRLPPLTRIVGELVAVWAVTPWRITVPPLTVRAGELPVMTVPSASVTVPPVTIKSPAEALPSTVTLPPLTVQLTGVTLAATTTVPLLTVALCTVAVPLDEVRLTCTLLVASNAVVGVAVAPSRSSVTVTGPRGRRPFDRLHGRADGRAGGRLERDRAARGRGWRCSRRTGCWMPSRPRP